MQLNKLALAVAALASAPVFALTPAQVNSATVRIWLSGASAPTAATYKAVLTQCAGIKYKAADGTIITNPGTNDVHLYLQNPTSGKLPGDSAPSGFSADRMAYTCTGASNTGNSLAGKKMVVYHTVEGGSFNAYAPHLKIAGEVFDPTVFANTLQRTANVESLGVAGQCAAGAATTVAIDISGQSNSVGVYYACGTTTQAFTAGQTLRANVFANPDRPDGGLSDTEFLINKLNLNVSKDVGDIGSETGLNLGQAFGVAVSYPLYFQLQKNDVASTVLPASCTAGLTAAAPNFTAACQPSMPTQRYTTVANVTSAGGVDGSLFGGAVGSIVNLARRTPTSGTQSASGIRFLNAPCATGAVGGAMTPARAADSTSTLVITEQSSTGGVKTALTLASNNNQFGLGVVSMENTPSGSDKYAFVKLNGVSPTFVGTSADAKQRANAVDGAYDFWYEMVSFKATTAFDEGKDLVDAVSNALSNPGFTDLKGLFVTAAAGYSATVYDNVSKGVRVGNSCSAAFQ